RTINKDGVEVNANCAWSLMDILVAGYVQRFSVTHVDYKTLVRTPKCSASYLRD
ncbi:hypothetical protein B0O99DRAFT_488298, partial [Bisporella sp. PMI_857]